jgi:hypothetical protein
MLKWTVSLALLTLLAGCQSARLIPTISTNSQPLVCSQWLVIAYHGNVDASDDIERIKRNNAARQAYCNG